jgi:O-antigen/teichoic acid export membrane protein
MQFNLATLVLATADRAAIATQAGPQSLGWYSAHFELATRPVGFARAIQVVLNPHMTHAVAQCTDVFPLWVKYTKIVFLVTSFGAWSATLFRDNLAFWILGPQYTETADIFGIVMLAQCFVVIGYACALLLNSFGDFRLQQRYYVGAAITMALAVMPTVSIGGITSVALLYFAVRGVDILLLYATLRQVGRKVLAFRTLITVTLWVATSGFAWRGESVLVMAGGVLLAFIMICTPLTRFLNED